MDKQLAFSKIHKYGLYDLWKVYYDYSFNNMDVQQPEIGIFNTICFYKKYKMRQSEFLKEVEDQFQILNSIKNYM